MVDGPIRAGSITYWLRNDASMKTLDRHYERSEEEKAEQRREFFEDD